MADEKCRGFARVEFIANQPEILEQLRKGHTRRAVYDELASKGKITMSYQRFCHYVSGKGRTKRVSVQPVVSIESTSVSASSSKPFDHNNQVTEETRHRLLGDE